MADEDNGRALWMATPFWGGGAESAARDVRVRVSEAIGKGAGGEHALPAIRWLLEREMLRGGQAAGMAALRRTDGAAAAELLKSLLGQPHPNADVAVGAIEEAGRRKLAGLAGEVGRLRAHYRAAVRNAAL
jgi:hypothetical protein